MPDPIQQAVSDAIDSVAPVDNTTAAAANDDAANNGAGADDAAAGADGAGAGDGSDNGGAAAGADDGQGADGAGDDAGAGDGGEGGEQLDLAEVTAKAPGELSDAEKAFIIENQDDLTGKQVKAYKEAGIDFEGAAGDDAGAADGDGVSAEPFKDTAPKLHEIPENDDDLIVKVQDAEGNEYEFTSIDDIPEDFQFKDSRQVVQIANALSELAGKRAERANLRAENEQITHSVETKNRVVEMWNGELAALQAEGVLPKGKADFLNGKFANKQVQDAVEGLFNYMTELNQKRQALGQPLLSSLRDVQHYRAADQAAAAAAEKAKHAKDVKTEKGKTVAASNTSTASSGGAKDEPTYVRGSGATIQSITEDAINSLGK